jgi:hypothetical protein
MQRQGGGSQHIRQLRRQPTGETVLTRWVGHLVVVMYLAGPAGKAAQNIPQQGLTMILSVSGVLALLFPLIGGALSGARGASVGQRRS